MARISIPGISDIEKAHSLVRGYVHQTPVISSELLNTLLGCDLFFKCENFQKTGAFKYRGSTHALLRLPGYKKQLGVATHSSGNHGAALAKAAMLQGIKAYIVMPANAPKAKTEAVEFYGGMVTFCEPTLPAREGALKVVVSRTGAAVIHPYDNFNVICGQGTACIELVEQISEPDFVVAPVGGGGLLSGTSIVAKSRWKKTRVIGAEPKNADDACRSFKLKTLVPSVNPDTIADGLLTSLSQRTLSIILNNVDAILTSPESSIVEAMKLVYRYLKIVIEPSAAVPLAVAIENRGLLKGKRVAIIISGGNVDLGKLPF